MEKANDNEKRFQLVLPEDIGKSSEMLTAYVF